MTDKLEWEDNAKGLMEYIGLVEAILLPDFEDYEYPFSVSFREAIKEETDKENASYVPLDATQFMSIF